MGLRSPGLLIGLLGVVLIAAVLTALALRAKPTALSMGVHRVSPQGEGLSAFLTLTNAGRTFLAVRLRYDCQVDLAHGSTNYLVDTRYTVFLHPGEGVVLSRTNYAVPLPADTRAWQVKVRVRPPTHRERFINTLIRWGLKGAFVSKFVAKLGGRPRKDEELRWEERQSQRFGVSVGPFLEEK